MSDANRLKFNLVENAIDYLVRAAELAEEDAPRAWKYALLHLVAGIELLLKARLQAEHWSLLFSNVDSASDKALAEGDFASVDFKTALDRLSNIAGVQLGKDSRSRLDSLRRYRNRVQHFAIDVDLRQVLPALGYGYHFSLAFIQEHLMGQMEESSTERLQTMTQRLTGFDEFVRQRLQDLKPELDAAYLVVPCPRCFQDCLGLGDGNPLCIFCGFTDSPEAVAAESDAMAGPEPCPECGGACVLLYSEAENPPGWVCFQCGESGDYDTCEYCGSLFSGESMPGDRCGDCWKALLEKD